MINEWKLYNFKSVERAELPLAPLTLFAGANSSGKSTFLQSILLISQTLASRVGTQTVVLNGHLAKLGQFNDLRNANTDIDTIRIAWDLSVPTDRAGESPYLRNRTAIKTISCDISFGAPKAKGVQAYQLNPRLFESVLSCAGEPSPTEAMPLQHSVRLTYNPQSDADSSDDTTQESARHTPWSFNYAIQFDQGSLEEIQDELSAATPIGCSFQHFVPQWLIERFDEKTEIIKALTRFLVDPLRSRLLSKYLNTDDIVIPQEIVAYFNARRLDLGKSEEMSGDPAAPTSLTTVLQWVRTARVKRRDKVPAITKELTEAAVAALPTKDGVTTAEMPPIFRDAVDYLVLFFSRSVRYLGPLREEPRSMYPLQTTADPQDIGLHGEHTAAVFHAYQHSEILYVPSSVFAERDVTAAITPSRATLKDAVFDWLNYLDVAIRVHTSDEGKFGHGLAVYLDAKVKQDLTHVGVGVSQVLPIVVMCLLADRETTLILEQPELHLNPKVQTRLGDFFLSMSLLGKQCLVETHSEYLINRLRFRAAAAPSDSLSRLMALYFVEKQKGGTLYRNVVINEFGAIVDWPTGFFDQSQREIEDILLAATRKAKGEKSE